MIEFAKEYFVHKSEGTLDTWLDELRKELDAKNDAAAIKHEQVDDDTIKESNDEQ
ncbi:MAG: hypothetical protein MHM6MM_005233 [Cercozoa sp. M6MM]